MTLLAIKYDGNELEILDQLLLPLESKYVPIRSVQDGWNAIKTMQVSRRIGALGYFSAPSFLICFRFEEHQPSLSWDAYHSLWS